MLIVTQFSSLVISAILAGLDFAALHDARLIARAISLGLAYMFALPGLFITIPHLVPQDQMNKVLAMDSGGPDEPWAGALAPVLSVVVFMQRRLWPALR